MYPEASPHTPKPFHLWMTDVFIVSPPPESPGFLPSVRSPCTWRTSHLLRTNYLLVTSFILLYREPGNTQLRTLRTSTYITRKNNQRDIHKPHLTVVSCSFKIPVWPRLRDMILFCSSLADGPGNPLVRFLPGHQLSRNNGCVFFSTRIMTDRWVCVTPMVLWHTPLPRELARAGKEGTMSHIQLSLIGCSLCVEELDWPLALFLAWLYLSYLSKPAWLSKASSWTLQGHIDALDCSQVTYLRIRMLYST